MGLAGFVWRSVFDAGLIFLFLNINYDSQIRITHPERTNHPKRATRISMGLCQNVEIASMRTCHYHYYWNQQPRCHRGIGNRTGYRFCDLLDFLIVKCDLIATCINCLHAKQVRKPALDWRQDGSLEQLALRTPA